MFAPCLHELLKGAELHRVRVSAETGATQGAVGYHCPIWSQGHMHIIQGPLSPPIALLCLVSQKTWTILWIVASLGAFIL